MNISLFNDSFPPEIDGVTNTVVNYAEILMKKGNKVNVIVPRYPGADDSVYPYPVVRYRSMDFRESIGYVAGYPFDPKIAENLQLFKPDILHTHCPLASTYLAGSLKSTFEAPLILTYHTKFDIDIANAINGKLLQAGAIKLLVSNVELCDEVWVVSEGAGKNLKSLGYKGDYIVMKNGVDIPKGRLLKEQYMAITEKRKLDLPSEIPTFLFVGRMMWYKGIKIILDALAGLKTAGINFRMVFVGQGLDEDEIKKYVCEKRLDDKVFFIGAVYDRSELCAWYCRSDLFLFPSNFDTSGLVVKEAAACSLPSVVIAESCAAEGVVNDQNGFLIHEDAADLAALLTKLCMDYNSGMLKSIGENAANELYTSWEDAVTTANKRYEIVLERYRSGDFRKAFHPREELFKLSGELMALFADIKRTNRTIQSEIKSEIKSRNDDTRE